MGKKKKNSLGGILFIIICLAVGAAMGFGAAFFAKDNLRNFVNAYFDKPNIFIEILILYGLMLILFLGYFIHIIIHEGGHLIFGLLSGYSFVSFRVGSFILIKEGNKFKFKRYNIPGTGGQCLMMPPEVEYKNCPFVLYNLGGVIMNLIVSTLEILVLIFVKGMSFPLSATLALTAAAGILIVILNGIPMKIGGVPNDGYNVLSLGKDIEAKRGFYLQLKVYGLMCLGTRIKDLSLEMFKLKEGSDLSNPLTASIRLLEYSWHLDRMDFNTAKVCIDSFNPYIDKIPAFFKREITCEKIFLELALGCDKEVIDELYDKDIKKYLKLSKYMIGKKRILMAYHGLYKKDEKKALKYYEEALKLAKKYPIKGDAESELEIMAWVKEKLDSMS